MSERDLKIRDLQENKTWLNDFITSFDKKYSLIASELNKRGLETNMDAVDYFTSESQSFAYILNEVFDGQTEVYKDLTNKQIISKIGDDFYNITGCITDEVKDHKLCGNDELGISESDYIEYLKEKVGNNDATDIFMTNSLIKVGNLDLDEKIENTKVK